MTCIPGHYIDTREVHFKDGSTHLERRCRNCGKHLGYEKKAKNKESLDWGKYEGQTYDQIAQKDPDYFRWVISKSPDPSSGGLHRWANKVHPIIKEALARYPKKVYVAEVITPERQEAIDKVNELRTKGLDFFTNL